MLSFRFRMHARRPQHKHAWAGKSPGSGRPRPQLERLEARTVLSTLPTSTGASLLTMLASYRPVDEVGNNAANPTLGTAGTDLLRLSPVAYADGVSAASLPNNPGARVLSDLLNSQADPDNPGEDLNTLDGKSLSDFGYVFGQFIDHDLDLTPTNPGQTLQILADPNDPSQMGNQTFQRSVTDPATGTGTSNPLSSSTPSRRTWTSRTSTARPGRWPTPCARTPAGSSRPAPGTCCRTTTSPTSRRTS